ncbi:hypothetical protein GGR54DRAFT_537528 [Hypoxylon sp. NC1633]|nr:hypothetical protein GGR54DRAFT_537528 [Hypoxylon sp. NC1633]
MRGKMILGTPNIGSLDAVVQHYDVLSWHDKRRTSTKGRQLRSKLMLTLLALLSFVWLTRLGYEKWFLTSPDPKQVTRSELERSQEPATTTPATLECFQVAQPVPILGGRSSQSIISNGSEAAEDDSPYAPCSMLLMEHVFGYSYGIPFVGNYTPPSCPFNQVIMNFTVVSQGRQFDRLALMYFGDTEVWRTSTAEPTPPPGIRWTFLKDMTEYLYFWKSPQKLIFDLGNLIDDKYTGSFNASLTATFVMADADINRAPPADLIIPISARKGAVDAASQFTLPAENATNAIKIPRNVNRAVFSVSANGQASEEFWWANVLQSDVLTFSRTAGRLPGLSPFREVQLFIDGNLAGVQWPFPVIFTGGVVPSLHRPVVGIQAFDLREHQIDITPWLPMLCDGAEKHTFTIQVAGLDDLEGRNGTALTGIANDSWYVTGKVFLWLDEEGSVTTGTRPAVELVGPKFSFSRHITQNATAFNETLAFDTVVERVISVKSTVRSKSQTGDSIWSQSLSYSNQAIVSDFGFTQFNNFTIAGTDSSTRPTASYKATYTYPLYCNQTYETSSQGNLTIRAHLIQGLELQVEGGSIFPTGLEAFDGAPAGIRGPYAASHLKTRRDGTAIFIQTGDGKNSSGYGATNQIFHFGGSKENVTLIDELYFRNVTAVNGTVVSDSERMAGARTYDLSQAAESANPVKTSLSLFAHVSGTVPGVKRSSVKASVVFQPSEAEPCLVCI